MASAPETTVKVTIEQAREGEDTHQWIARLHRENAQKAAQETTNLQPNDAGFDLDFALLRANKAELREMVKAYRFLLLSRGATEADFAAAETAACRIAKMG